MFEYEKLKKYIFKIDPETAHNITECGLRMLPYCRFLNNYLVKQNFVTNPILSQKLFGKEFLNPVGLAAGFDKNATIIKSMIALGFGFSEVGTVTPLPQAGNPRPRIFRFPKYNSIQNSMGFNNNGMEYMTKKLKNLYPFSIPIFVSIGKNKTTPAVRALEDYKRLIENFHILSDILVINISSPNTPGLRDLQNEVFLKDIFSMAKDITNKPILIKLAPDIDISKGINLVTKSIEFGAKGVILNNTSLDYSLLPNAKNIGGISGEAIKEKSYNFFKAISKEVFGKTILISVGGISDANEAYKRIKAGANLVQVLSALIFKGPSLVRNMNENLINLLKTDGFKNIDEAIGAEI